MKQIPFPEIPKKEFGLRKKKAMKLMGESKTDGTVEGRISMSHLE
jgi:hypothetical protein